jgi:hypothetical protein
LELFCAIASVNNQHGIKENQIEIMKQLTSPGNIEHVLSYFVPVTDVEYKQKQDLMQSVLSKAVNGNEFVKYVDLPVPLQYHIRLLDTFSSLTVGKTNGITAIEAKLQSLYETGPLIDAILDSQSLLVVKAKLSMYLYNGMIDVELKIPGLEYTASIWKLLTAINDSLLEGPENFRTMRQLGLGHKKLARV